MLKKNIVLGILVLALALPLSAETWKNAPLMDVDCSDSKLDNPDKHTLHCALKCADSGFGIVVDKKFIKFDDKGNELAKAALEKTEKKDHLRVTVDGELKDDAIAVSKLTLD